MTMRRGNVAGPANPGPDDVTIAGDDGPDIDTSGGGRRDVTVVIVTYKSADHIAGCIDSVLESGATVPLKVVVVDNASHDGTVEMIRSRFPEAELIENPRNVGFASAVNRGASLATSRYLMILNPDTRLPEGTLETLVQFLEKKGDRCFVSPRTVDEAGSSVPCVRSLPHGANMIQYLFRVLTPSKRFKRPLRWLLDLWQGNEVINVNHYGGYLIGAAILTPLDLFREIGMFDDRYFLYLEDADLGLRTAKAGYAAYYVHDARVVHYGGQSARKNSMSSVFFIESYMAYIKKNVGGLHGLLLKGSLTCFVLFTIFLAVTKRDGQTARLLLRTLRPPGRRSRPTNAAGPVML
jgi:GT2 family glycosyltransferase